MLAWVTALSCNGVATVFPANTYRRQCLHSRVLPRSWEETRLPAPGRRTAPFGVGATMQREPWARISRLEASRQRPFKSRTSTVYQRITAGNAHVCAVQYGSLYCWGNNAEGEFGTGNTTNSSTPVYSRPYAGIISAGMYHTCVAESISGSVICTGSNGYGQLGNNSSSNSTSWVASGSLTSVIGLAAGYFHTCALGADYTVRCWGWNVAGNLGDGTTTNRLVPTLVGGLTNVQQIQTGYSHTCALLQGGTVSCWGQAPYVGTGQTTNQLTPQTIPGLSGVIAVHTTQGFHSCVELAGHSVNCWGANNQGQVGDGSLTYVPRPLQITF